MPLRATVVGVDDQGCRLMFRLDDEAASARWGEIFQSLTLAEAA